MCFIIGRFNGSRAILSGPAGGVVGYALTTYNAKIGQAVIGFDMGGKRILVVCDYEWYHVSFICILWYM